MRLRMAVIGVGHLGKEHARILAGMRDVELVGVADANPAQAQAVAERLGTQAFTEYWPLLNLVDAASIVVPTCHHAEVASEFLRHGIPVLVEKPLAMNLKEADALAELADQNKAILQVGHIERFNPAFQEIQSRNLQPKLIRAERIGPFAGRSADIGVVLDLMIHDLDLTLALAGTNVVAVEALGISVFGRHEDLANARLRFDNGCVAELTASRASPVASRQMSVWSPEGCAMLDFGQRKVTLVQPSSEVRQHGLDPAKLDAASRTSLKEDLFTRHLPTVHIDGQSHDQLSAELRQFVDCVQTGTRPYVSGWEGRDAIAVAERILTAISQHRWTQAGDFAGPLRLPPALGPLFTADPRKEVA